MAYDNNAIVAPVGAAFKVMMDSFASAIWLYQPDSSHPVVTGSYLEACVLYSSIFHKRTLGGTYLSGLPAATAATLQRVADKVTMDSLVQWQQYGHYPYAGFISAVLGHTATFNALNTMGTSNWQFGDGATSAVASPTHTYASNGVYVVQHTVTTSCFTERLTDTVRIGTAGVQELNNGYTLQVGSGKGYVTFADHAGVFDFVDVYSLDGRLVQHMNTRESLQLYATPGMYIYRAYSLVSGISTSGKVVVY
jgi:hypothetical protein